MKSVISIDKTFLDFCSQVASCPEMLPKAYTNLPPEKRAGAIAIALIYGHTVGLDYGASIAGICVVNGIPTLWGGVLAAHAQSSGVEWDVVQSDWERCEIKLTYKGKSYISIDTTQDAARRGSLNDPKKPAWQTNTKEMLFRHALRLGISTLAPEVLWGFTDPDSADFERDPMVSVIPGQSGENINLIEQKEIKEPEKTTDNQVVEVKSEPVQTIGEIKPDNDGEIEGLKSRINVLQNKTQSAINLIVSDFMRRNDITPAQRMVAAEIRSDWFFKLSQDNKANETATPLSKGEVQGEDIPY